MHTFTTRSWGSNFKQSCTDEQLQRVSDMNVDATPWTVLQELYWSPGSFVFPEYCSRIWPFAECMEAVRVGVVWPRVPSSYATQLTTECVRALRWASWVWTISGWAAWTDSLVHAECVNASIPTCVVVGSWLWSAFRGTQRGLFQSVLDVWGCVISWFPFLQRAARWTFPVRNRLLVALSSSITIPELKEWSWTAITYEEARKQWRVVHCFPRSILGTSAESSNEAILSWACLWHATVSAWKSTCIWYSVENWEALTDVVPEEYAEYRTILEQESTIDDLMRQLDVPIQDLLWTLTLMELDGLCRQTTPWRYINC